MLVSIHSRSVCILVGNKYGEGIMTVLAFL